MTLIPTKTARNLGVVFDDLLSFIMNGCAGSCITTWIQNAPAHLVFNQSRRAHVTPLLISLHWLPDPPGVKFFDAGFRIATGNAFSTLTIARFLNHLVVPSQQVIKSHSKTFTLYIPLWWNELPTSTLSAETITTFKKHKHFTNLQHQTRALTITPVYLS